LCRLHYVTIYFYAQNYNYTLTLFGLTSENPLSERYYRDSLVWFSSLNSPFSYDVVRGKQTSLSWILIGQAEKLEKADATWNKIIKFSKSKGIFKTVNP